MLICAGGTSLNCSVNCYGNRELMGNTGILVILFRFGLCLAVQTSDLQLAPMQGFPALCSWLPLVLALSPVLCACLGAGAGPVPVTGTCWYLLAMLSGRDLVICESERPRFDHWASL